MSKEIFLFGEKQNISFVRWTRLSGSEIFFSTARKFLTKRSKMNYRGDLKSQCFLFFGFFRSSYKPFLLCDYNFFCRLWRYSVIPHSIHKRRIGTIFLKIFCLYRTNGKRYSMTWFLPKNDSSFRTFPDRNELCQFFCV